jgi:RNA polymerase sigma factor (sigma-70 family)
MLHPNNRQPLNRKRGRLTRLIDAQRQLVADNIGLAGWAAHRVWPFCRELTTFEDVFQAATFGLMRAAQLFDPSRGVKFATYGARGAFATAWRHKEVCEQNYLVQPVSKLAGAEGVIESLEARPDERTEPDPNLWVELMEFVTDREQRVLTLRFQEGLTFAQIGERLGVSTQRASQLADRAMTRLYLRAGKAGIRDRLRELAFGS